MRALELTGVGLHSLRLSEREAPRPGPREVLLRVRCAGLNYRDLAIARGEYGGYERPLVLGSDAVGEVVARGAEVTRVPLGARVCPTDTPDWIAGPLDARSSQRRLGGPLDGALQELLCVHEDALVIAPDYLSDAEAASLCGAGVTAWQALYPLAALRPGQSVLIQGTGGVSLFALQLALQGGARPIVISRSTDKLQRVRQLGAADLIHTQQHPAWDEEVLRRTDGTGVDVVIEVLGGEQLARSIAATRMGGSVVVLGFVAGAHTSLDLPALIRRGITLHTSTGRSREHFEAFMRAAARAQLHPVIDRELALSDARTAFEHLATPAAFGKTVVRVST